MLHAKRTLRADHIWFADDIFALSPQWTRTFADEVETIGAALPFKMQSRCDLMTRDTVGALRRAGCTEIWMGAESGSQKVLDAMDKGTRVEHIYEARENLREAVEMVLEANRELARRAAAGRTVIREPFPLPVR